MKGKKQLGYEDDPSAKLFREQAIGSVEPNLKTELTIARSWYEVKRDDAGWIIHEHRGKETREYRCASHGEVNRIRQRLSSEGLIGIGEAL